MVWASGGEATSVCLARAGQGAAQCGAAATVSVRSPAATAPMEGGLPVRQLSEGVNALEELAATCRRHREYL